MTLIRHGFTIDIETTKDDSFLINESDVLVMI